MAEPTFPELYEKVLVNALFRPFIDPLLDEVQPSQGERMLDLCCGTGIVSREAAKRAGEANLVGVDIDPEMLAVASQVAPAIEWREGDIQALPFDDQTFDVAVCHQGLQFVPNKAKAAAEFRRVLKSEGRIGLATWRPVEENPLFLDLQEVGERRLGPIEDKRHSFGDASTIEALLRDAGFGRVRTHIVSRRITMPEGRMFVRMNSMALVGMAGVEPEKRREAATEIASESEAVFAKYSQGDALVFELSTNLIAGQA